MTTTATLSPQQTIVSPLVTATPSRGQRVLTPVIVVTDLTKTYRGKKGQPDKVAVNGLDLTVFQGEVFAILGPNGAGKTTTVEILEGFRKRDSGQVTVLGEDPANPSRAWRSRVGIVLQSANDMDKLTVFEAISSTASYYPNPRDPNEVINAVGLDEKRNASLKSLSGGQRRRVDVALAIVGRPELLFLDEPTTGFDPEARRDFWDLIRTLNTDGTSVILTTHYMDEAAALADRIAVIVNGQVVALDTPAGLAEGHASLEDAYLHTINATRLAA
ncbi:MAG: ABC transporter ATP-binding protein [Promicromonosporaceae bacterium]|nr:ABC transporter ATP-binding protein [Promicromonosporaceae bacterium]